MPTTEELIKQTDELNEAEKYQEVIDLLTDELLEEKHSAELYTGRARANGSLTNLEELFQDCKTAIAINPNYFKPYNTRGFYWFSKNQYDKAIEDYNHAIHLKPDYAIAFNNRGIAWANKGQYDKAIEDYSHAIQLKPDYAHAFNNRGNAWANKGQYDKAIEDYSYAIQLKPDYADAFNDRGNAWADKGQYDKAIEDYSHAIQLKPDDANAFYNRGVAWYDKGQYDKAIEDFDHAIQLKPDDAITHRNLASIYYESKDYNKSLKYYEKALTLNKNDFLAIIRIESIKARLNEELEEQKDSAAWFISDIIKKVENENNRKITRDKALDVLDAMDRIRNHAHISNPESVVHYSKMNIAELFIKDQKSNLRFYNVLYMNDPEEGKIMFDCLDNNKEAENIHVHFNKGYHAPDGDTNVYLGSFLPAPETDNTSRFSHEDELVLWRTYGKNELGEEARGCSIVIDHRYFSNESGYMQQLSGLENNKVRKQESGTDTKKYPLYRVLYYDKRLGRIISADGIKEEELNEDLQKLRNAVCTLITEGKQIGEETIICQIIYRILSELRYFFKSADYSYENECRVIIYANPENPRVMIDEQSTSPKKLYYAPETQIQPYIKKIYLGPRVVNADAWKMYLDVAIRKNKEKPELKDLFGDIQVLKSTQKFQ